MFQGFEERLQKELQAVLPQSAPLRVRKAKDPVLDAWRGAAQWAAAPSSRQHFITRADFMEKGGDYIKVSPCSRSVINSHTDRRNRNTSVATALRKTRLFLGDCYRLKSC